MTKQFRIRKYIRNKYKIKDIDLDWFIMQKYALGHVPTRLELFKLEYPIYRFMNINKL